MLLIILKNCQKDSNSKLLYETIWKEKGALEQKKREIMETLETWYYAKHTL